MSSELRLQAWAECLVWKGTYIKDLEAVRSLAYNPITAYVSC